MYRHFFYLHFCCVVFCFFFFFQAEDGIRDHCVTGVQTCALPISCSTPAPIAIPNARSRVAPAASAAGWRQAERDSTTRAGEGGGAGAAGPRRSSSVSAAAASLS